METQNQLPTSKLPPLEEVLFKAWTKANDIKDPDEPNNSFDYRSLYSMSNGKVQPTGMVKDMATEHNNQMEQQKAAQDVAKKQEADRKKEASEAIKKQESAQKREFDIAKTQMTLQQLMMKRELGL